MAPFPFYWRKLSSLDRLPVGSRNNVRAASSYPCSQSHRFALFVLPISSSYSRAVELCHVALNHEKSRTKVVTESRILATWSKSTPVIWKKTTNRSKIRAAFLVTF